MIKLETIKTKITDSAIRRALKECSVNQIRDERYPLYLRINKVRSGGSWYLRDHVQDRWHRLALWPQVKAETVLKDLPLLMTRLSINEPPVLDNFATFGELLGWYLERSCSNRELSGERKASLKSLVSKHLIPKLGDSKISSFEKSDLEDKLLWPTQRDYQTSTCRQIFQALKAATNQAVKSGKLNRDPLSGIKFGDIIQEKITPKKSAIRKQDIPLVVTSVLNAAGPAGVLCQLMLLHATRIGETRQTRWSWIDTDNRAIEIPEEVTKTKSHTVYLSDLAYELLIKWNKEQRSFGYRGDFLFPSQRSLGPISEKQASEYVLSVSQGAYTSHDFRKLCRVSWLELGIDSLVAELMLNHELPPVQKTYVEALGINVGSERRKAAWQNWAEYLLKLKDEYQSDTVTRSHEFVCSR